MTHAEIRARLTRETDPHKRHELQWLLDRTPDEQLAAGTVSAPEPEVLPDLEGNVSRPRGIDGLY